MLPLRPIAFLLLSETVIEVNQVSANLFCSSILHKMNWLSTAILRPLVKYVVCSWLCFYSGFNENKFVLAISMVNLCGSLWWYPYCCCNWTYWAPKNLKAETLDHGLSRWYLQTNENSLPWSLSKPTRFDAITAHNHRFASTRLFCESWAGEFFPSPSVVLFQKAYN